MADTDEATPARPAPEHESGGSYIVGLGASAGGLEALEKFFASAPSDTGLTFIVIQHLSPDYKSLMAELLAKHTRMPVAQAVDNQRVEPDHIYLIPPKKNMLLYHGKLLLTEQESRHGLNLPIDIFLRSLAEDCAERAIGIIFSGTGSDGMRGVRAIKEAGGMVMAQDEESAKFDGMPRSAASTGLVDFILPPESMPERLVNYVSHPFAALRERNEPTLASDADSFAKIIAQVKRQTGVDFAFYKPSTVSRRIERRMSVNQLEEIGDYVRYIYQSPREVTALYKDLLIGVTSFFRDPEAFELVRTKAIPAIFENREEEDVSVRVWVASCSTGEEAYSVAMLLAEYVGTLDRAYDIKVFATDIDREAIEFASNGVYPESIAADVSGERLAKYFIKKGDNYHVHRRVRESVIFATQNLLRDPPFTRIDLCCCRNLLIYFQPALQKKVLTLFRFSLRPGGFLFLGSSETVGDLADQFEPVDTKWKLYRCRGGGRPTIADSLAFIPEPKTRRGQSFVAPRAEEPDRAMERIYQALLADYVPPCVVVDEQATIQHVFGDTEAYIKFSPGRASLNLGNLAHKDLSVPLSTALHRARKDHKEIVYHDIRFRHEEMERALNLRIKPILERRLQQYLYAVFFEEAAAPARPAPESRAYQIDDSSALRIADLEQELQYTKENLQATIEELETSNEELQATNEELLAANEELQSTNEELQSVNEELYTVNAEYQNKIQELTDLNNDMDNLLLSTEIGTLFLDDKLCIRKYTPPVAKVLSVLPQDIGRPLAHIAHSLRYANLIEDVRQVLTETTGLERKVESEADEHYLLRLAPYQIERQPAPGGVVVSLINITALTHAQQDLEQEHRFIARVMDTTPSCVTVVDRTGRITFANRKAEELLGLSRKELTGRTYNDPKWKISALDGDPFPQQDLPYHRVFDRAEDVIDCRHAIELPDGQRIPLSINASPLRNEKGETEAMVCFLEDITRARDRDRRIQVKRSLLDHINEALLSVYDDGTIRYCNAAAEKALLYSRGELIGQTLAGALALGAADDTVVIFDTVRERGCWEGEVTLRRRDGTNLLAWLRCDLIRDDLEQDEPIIAFGLVLSLVRET